MIESLLLKTFNHFLLYLAPIGVLDPVEWQLTVFNVPISTVDNTITSHHLKVPEVKEFCNKLSLVSLACSLVL